MDLAKPRIDIGLATNDLEPMLAFWREAVDIPFDHLLKIRRGQDQHRHDALGAVVKVNHFSTPIEASPAGGYRELIIARPGLAEARALVGPDGVRVSLVPAGSGLVSQIGVFELSFRGKELVNQGMSGLFVFGMISLIYFALSYPLTRLGRWLEKRLASSRGQGPERQLRQA